MTIDPEPIDPSNVRPGPIQHAALSDEMLTQIRWIYDMVGPYLDTTLEAFEINFMRDMFPEDEVLLWTCIVSAWIDYHKKYLGNETLSDEEEKKLFAALIAISTGVEDVEQLGVSPDVGRNLLECYNALGEELK